MVRQPQTPFGGLLRELRQDARLTAAQVGKKAGVSQGYVTRLELGEVPPTSTAVEQLTRVLDPGGWSLFHAAGIAPPIVEGAFRSTPDLLLLVSRLPVAHRRALYRELAPMHPGADPASNPAWSETQRRTKRLKRKLLR